VNTVKLVEVIYAEWVKGEGSRDDPSRVVRGWFETDGTLIHEEDNWLNSQAESVCQADTTHGGLPSEPTH